MMVDDGKARQPMSRDGHDSRSALCFFFKSSIRSWPEVLT
jgi:hypothetical protein